MGRHRVKIDRIFDKGDLRRRKYVDEGDSEEPSEKEHHESDDEEFF